MSSRAEYYILDTRSVVGNCGLWWRPDGNGYTCELWEAGLYTWEQAIAHRETDVPIHKDDAEAVTCTHVRLDRLARRVPLRTLANEQHDRVRQRYLDTLGIDIDAEPAEAEQ